MYESSEISGQRGAWWAFAPSRDAGLSPPELKHDNNCALTRASAWVLEPTVGSKANSGDFAHSPRNVTASYVGGWQLWIAAKSHIRSKLTSTSSGF